MPVKVSAATRHDLPISLQGLATVQAFNTVTIRAQVDGQLQKILFKEGQTVHAGDILAEIDARGFQAAVDQALAKKAQDEAQLANIQLDLKRYSALVEQNYVARQQFDSTKAQLDQLSAAIEGDKAALASARVTLGYATIRSPIDGRAGIRQVDVGNILRAADATGIVTIAQTKPISLLFTLPEDSVQKLLKAMANGPVSVEALSRDGAERLDEGVLETLDNQIDTTTGTVRLKATMPNKPGRLWPGQFVTARLQAEILPHVLVIPSKAVQHGPQGNFAFVVKDDNTVEARPLTLGENGQDLTVVTEGIAEGERVVTDGQYRLQTGSHVAP